MMRKRRWRAGWLAGTIALGVVGALLRAGAGAEPAKSVPPIVVQAIDFSGQGGGQVTVHAHGRGASPAYIHEWCTPGHWLEWTIDATDAGEYQLELRYGEKFETARAVAINGQTVKGLESMAFPSTGSWQGARDMKAPAPISLVAGKNILRMKCLDSQSLWLYQITLLRGDKRIVIDPSHFTGQGGGKVQAIVSDEHGFFSMWDTRGHALEWTIPKAAAGEYKLTLCYATREVPVRELRVNGKVVPGFEAFRVPWTGGWRNWCVAELPREVPLEAGRNVLRMTNLEASLDISYLRLSAPGKPDIVIDAVDMSGEEGGKVQIHAPAPSFLDGWNKAGQWLEWKFKAPAAGDYTVTVRYRGVEYSSDMESPADLNLKPRRFEMNGSVVKGLEAYMVPGRADGTPRDWNEADLPVTVNLRAGLNDLKITNLSDGPLKLYEMRFTPVSKP